MSKLPFMPLFWGDVLAATPTWSGEERSLYITLLAYQWSAGPLPSDPKRIAKMCQYDQKNFLDLWQVVGTKFRLTDEGLLNDSLEEHRDKAKSVGKKRAEAGKEGAAKRWQKPSDENGKPMANAKVVAIGKGIASANGLLCHPIQSNPEGREEVGEEGIQGGGDL